MRGVRLRTVVARAIRSSRRRASGSPTGSGTTIKPTRLPRVSGSVPARNDTGTEARSTRFGFSSPRDPSSSRAPPATAASTTSFTFAPCSWAAAFTRARSARTSRRSRRRPTGTFSDVRGARPSAAYPRIAAAAARIFVRHVPGRDRHATAPRRRSRMRRTSSANSSPAVGRGAGIHGGAVAGGASAVTSSSAPSEAMEAMPSAITWWERISIPTRPPSSPVRNHSSQSGRDRASGGSFSARQVATREASSPGAGTARAPTCSPIRKPGSSTHTGGPSPGGGSKSTWRRRGARWSRRSTCARRASRGRAPSASRNASPSSTSSAATCIGWPCSSTRRFPASWALTRSSIRRGPVRFVRTAPERITRRAPCGRTERSGSPSEHAFAPPAP